MGEALFPTDVLQSAPPFQRGFCAAPCRSQLFDPGCGSCQCVSIRVYPCLFVSIFWPCLFFCADFANRVYLRVYPCLSVSIRVYPCLFLHMQLIPIRNLGSLPCEKLEKIDATSPWRDCVTLEQNLMKNRRAPKVPHVFQGGGGRRQAAAGVGIHT